jgi:hypothetical protein
MTPEEEPLPSTLEGWESRKTELIAEKAEISARMAELKAILKGTPRHQHGSPANREALEERAQLVADYTEIEAEIRQANDRIRELKTITGITYSPFDRDLPLIVQLIAYRRISGQPDTIEQLTAMAFEELIRIRAELARLKPEH